MVSESLETGSRFGLSAPLFMFFTVFACDLAHSVLSTKTGHSEDTHETGTRFGPSAPKLVRTNRLQLIFGTFLGGRFSTKNPYFFGYVLSVNFASEEVPSRSCWSLVYGAAFLFQRNRNGTVP